MRRFLVLCLTGMLLVSPISPSHAAAVKAGGTCTKLGKKAVTGGRHYICAKSGAKKVWKMQIVLPKTSMPYPAVTGAAPSPKVMAFYYAWYGSPSFDGSYVHWDDRQLLATDAPADIASDYFPQLGAYSSSDPNVIAQHMAWLRRAGVGVIVVSWWRSAPTTAQMWLILDMAYRYGIKVAFHMEPAQGRSATSLVTDVAQLIKRFGNHPAFFRTTASSLYLNNSKPKPIFFVWATVVPENGQPFVQSDYWTTAMDKIHAQSNALMIGTPGMQGYGDVVSNGHFDGAYNYITIHLQEEGGFNWSHSLPPGALYIPSVAPGNHADRVKYPPSTILPRNDGGSYNDQWNAALNTGIAPDFVTITSFNEWHEGSMIEPPRADYTSSDGRRYLDFGPKDPMYYLDATASWAAKYVNGEFPTATLRPIRITVTTTSDWAVVTDNNAVLVRPGKTGSTGVSAVCSFNGSRLAANQPLVSASAGSTISCSWEISATSSTLALNGQSGALGSTSVKIEQFDGTEWKSVDTWNWMGVAGETSRSFSLS